MIQIPDKSLNYMGNCGKIGTEQSGVSAPLMPLTNDLQRRQSMASDDCIIAPFGAKIPRGYALTQVTVGAKFYRLTVVAGPFKNDRGRSVFQCVCDCGQAREAQPASLISGKHQSCGCLTKDLSRQRAIDRNFRHGEASPAAGRSPEYRVWHSMKQRCNNPAHAAYASYGGRGITIYPAWNESFQEFLRDVGRRPSPRHSIDRIDNNRGYEPGNVRWATRVEQCANRRSTVLITINGETRIISEWVRHFKVDSRRLNRLLRRMSPEDVAAVLSK